VELDSKLVVSEKRLKRKPAFLRSRFREAAKSCFAFKFQENAFSWAVDVWQSQGEVKA
jgi:hypothetical protein